MTSLKWPVDLMNRLIAVIAMTIYTTKLVLSRLNADWNILKAKYIHIQWRVSWTVKSEANLGKWYVSWGNSLLFSHDGYFFKSCSTKLYAFCCRMCLIWGCIQYWLVRLINMVAMQQYIYLKQWYLARNVFPVAIPTADNIIYMLQLQPGYLCKDKWAKPVFHG